MGTVVRAQLKPDPDETASGRETLPKEMAEAYKDISNVAEVVHKVGISKKVARLRPIGVIKG